MEIWQTIPSICGYDTFLANVPKKDQKKYEHYGQWENYVKMNFKG